MARCAAPSSLIGTFRLTVEVEPTTRPVLMGPLSTEMFNSDDGSFVIGLVADLLGSRRDYPAAAKDRRFVTINETNFDEVMQAFRPEINVCYQNSEAPVVQQGLSFKR